MGLLNIIISILLPPLGVFMNQGLSQAFVINVLLTFLGWLPGSIHALWIASKKAEQANV